MLNKIDDLFVGISVHRKFTVWTAAVLLGTACALLVVRHQDAGNRPHEETPNPAVDAQTVESESRLTNSNASDHETGIQQPAASAEDQAVKVTAMEIRIRSEARGHQHDYRRFLEESKLGTEQKMQLMRLSAERALLVKTRAEGLSRGAFRNVEEADAYYRAESRRLDQEMRGLLAEEYPAFWVAAEKVSLQRQMDVFAQLTAKHDTSLDIDQRDMLVDTYWEHYKEAGIDFFFTPIHSRVPPGGAFTDQMVKRSQADLLVRMDAAAFLTASQLERLQSFQTNQILGMYRLAKFPKPKG